MHKAGLQGQSVPYESIIGINAYIQEHSCAVPAVGMFAYNAHMDGLAADQELIRKLVAWTGHRPAAIARAANVANTTINRPYKGTATTRISQPTLDKLKGAYPMFPGWKDAVSPAPAPNASVIRMEGASAERMAENLPVYGTASGAPMELDGQMIEQSTLNRGEIIQYVKRPVILNGQEGAYGLYVVNSSMEPVHMEGSLILAQTRRPPRSGDDVVVYLRDREEDDGERSRGVIVKRLVARGPNFIELRQFNPDITFKIPLSDTVRIDRVLTLADLLA